LVIYRCYRALKKWGNLLIQAMPYRHKGAHKISIRMDNSTATKHWIDMQNPGIIDFAGPKEMRFMAWAEKMAFTRELPMDTQFIPGNMNSFADLVSRITEKLGEAARRRKHKEMDVIVAHTEMHTFDTGSEEHEGEVPTKFKCRHLKLTTEDAREIQRAQQSDTEVVHKVKLGDVAKCVLGKESEVTPEISQKIMPWIGRTYFKITHPETQVELMYTPVSATRVHWETEDATKVLVLQAPNQAIVKLTSSQELFETEQTGNETPDWITKQTQLKGQLMSLCHDMQTPHPSDVEMITSMKRLAHWPTMVVDAENHKLYCADCLEDRKHRVEAGTGIVSAERLKFIQMDHYILPKERADICGVPMILTITDVATRITSYEPAYSQTALATAKVIYKRWIPYYGIPDMLISDPHPGFASEVMGHLRQIMGIKSHELAAKASKGKTAMVESRHNELTAALSDGFAKGDIKNADDLEMYLARAKTRHDQQGTKTTPFECLTGQKPANKMNMALLQAEKKPKAMNKEELNFCAQIEKHTSELMQINLWQRDDKARTNARRRHQDLGRSAKHTHFDMKKGDEVSYDGKLYKLGATTGASENKPISAEIITKEGKSKTVQYKDLKPADTPRPGNFLTREMPEEGSLIIWEDEEHLRAGLVTSTDEHKGNVTVHEHQATQETSLYWLPMWEHKNGKQVRAKEAPAGSKASHATISVNNIKMTGDLTLTFALASATKKEARAKGLI
jgi:hypothetical protein